MFQRLKALFFGQSNAEPKQIDDSTTPNEDIGESSHIPEVTITLTSVEVLLLSDLLWRFEEHSQLETESNDEIVALWNLSALLEKTFDNENRRFVDEVMAGYRAMGLFKEKTPPDMHTIHVFDEGDGKWKSVRAKRLKPDIYQITSNSKYDYPGQWQFDYGDVVRCEAKTHEWGGTSMIAVELIRKGLSWDDAES